MLTEWKKYRFEISISSSLSSISHCRIKGLFETIQTCMIFEFLGIFFSPRWMPKYLIKLFYFHVNRGLTGPLIKIG